MEIPTWEERTSIRESWNTSSNSSRKSIARISLEIRELFKS